MIDRVLYYFEELAKIPHGSGNTKAISDFCVEFAKEHGFKYYQDEQNNVVIYKKGNKDTPPVILQGHLDMVCEKEASVEFDFEKDALRLVRDDNTLKAAGTTLGGDDGIAVAMCLAILESNEISHPDLEVVFTTDEETGMFGAQALDADKLSSKRLLNIDSEVENVLTVGCAGGARAEIKLPVTPQFLPLDDEDDEDVYKVTVTGLIGGHSGVEIDKGRQNSNIIMGEFLNFLLCHDYNLRIVDICGGKADNIIPNETTATIFASYAGYDEKENELETLIDEFIDEIKLPTDPGLKIDMKPTNLPRSLEDETTKEALCSFLGSLDTERVINFLCETPNGIMAMSKDIEGLVETSLNLGQLYLTINGLVARFSVRSSVKREKQVLLARLDNLAADFKGTMTSDGHYPAWEYMKVSPFRDKVYEALKEVFISAPKVEAIHAGLECGIFCEKIEGLEAVSIGPNIFDIHTPRETLDLKSTEKTYRAIIKLLETL